MLSKRASKDETGFYKRLAAWTCPGDIRAPTMDEPSVLSAGDSMVSDWNRPQLWGAGSMSPSREGTVVELREHQGV